MRKYGYTKYMHSYHRWVSKVNVFFFVALSRATPLRDKRATRIFVPASEFICTTNEIILFFRCAAGAKNFQRFFAGEILEIARDKRATKKKTLLVDTYIN